MAFRRLFKTLQIPVMSVLGVAGPFCASESSAVTQYTKERKPFIFDSTPLHSILVLPLTDSVEKVKIPEFQLRERALKAAKDETVEPLTLTLPNGTAQKASLLEKVAAPEKVKDFEEYIDRVLQKEKKAEAKTPKTVVIDENGLELISPEAFGDLFSRNHHNLTASGPELKNSPEVRRQLFKEIAPFLSRSEREDLSDRIKNGAAIEVDRFLLPEFAKKMVGKFISFRGPNCFHAALAFQSPKFTSSSWVNVKEEKGYHRAMINYDELWSILSRNFYEVPATEAPLKYGDILVFFDVPKAAEKDPSIPVDFHWIRHTATYLFNGYTFSKGSKSPNTPYLVRTLNEEWTTWKGYTKNLGLKIFRRSSKKIKVKPAFDATDWVY
jgi:hypothetical protein